MDVVFFSCMLNAYGCRELPQALNFTSILVFLEAFVEVRVPYSAILWYLAQFPGFPDLRNLLESGRQEPSCRTRPFGRCWGAGEPILSIFMVSNAFHNVLPASLLHIHKNVISLEVNRRLRRCLLSFF